MSIKRSLIWDYFIKEDNITAECLSCKKKIANRGNTSNLISHLKLKHPLKFFEYEAKKKKQDTESSSDTEPGPSQITATKSSSDIQVISSPSPQQASTSQKKQQQIKIDYYRKMDSKMQEKATKALGYFIAVDMLPYNTVEKIGFKHFLKVIAPSFEIPGRKVLTDRIIPRLYSDTCNIIKSDLNTKLHISLTTDCWTSNNNTPYISLTCHYISDDWTLKSACLNCIPLTEDHTAVNIADALNDMLNMWDISEEKIVGCTTDSGYNIVAAINNLNWNHINCFGHSVNSGITNALKIEELEEPLKKIKKIQNIFSHSWKLNRELKTVQERFNAPIKKIPSFSITRWWSLLHLIEVIVEQHLVLISLLSDYNNGKFKQYILSQSEIDILNITIKAIKPLEIISTHLSGEDYITASAIIPVCQKISSNMAETSTILKEVDNILTRRYANSNLLHKVMFLDPKFKSTYLSNNDIESITEDIKKEMETVAITTAITESIPKKKRKTGLALILETTGERSELPASEKIVDEIEMFKSLPNIDVEEDSLEWWKRNCMRFPALAQLAKKYLCLQATSVASERIFSAGGNVINDCRSSLTGEHAEQLIFLFSNKSIVPTTF